MNLTLFAAYGGELCEAAFLQNTTVYAACGCAAPVRAVEVSGKAANFAQAEFISAEHLN